MEMNDKLCKVHERKIVPRPKVKKGGPGAKGGLN